jgi:hypothetical protein
VPFRNGFMSSGSTVKMADNDAMSYRNNSSRLLEMGFTIQSIKRTRSRNLVTLSDI